MAKKSTQKKISVNAFEKAYEEMTARAEYTTIEWRGLEIEVKFALSLREMMEYVEEVSTGCFIGDEGKYVPEVRDFFNAVALIGYYTNISLPANTERQYGILCNANSLIEAIYAVINWAQYTNIQNAIDARISNYNSVATSIAIRQLETVSAAVESLEQKFAEMFGGINGDDLNAAIKAIGETGFNEESLVNAVLERRKTKEE